MIKTELYLKMQRLAFETAQYTASKMTVGMSEIDAAQMMSDYLREKGVSHYFHYPFAWFGERTAFINFQKPLSFLDSKKSFWPSLKSFSWQNILPHFGSEFMPKNIKLKKDTAVILDLAPAVDGIFVDIGFSFFFGECPLEYTRALATLLKTRELIPQIINQGATNHQLYIQVEELFKENGFSNRHSLYPLGVLGHRVGELPLFSLPKNKVMGFDLSAFLYILKQELPFATPTLTTPFLREGIHLPIGDGLWAVEPHLGNHLWGAKFEEILIVKEGKAHWLDSTAPTFLQTNTNSTN